MAGVERVSRLLQPRGNTSRFEDIYRFATRRFLKVFRKLPDIGESVERFLGKSLVNHLTDRRAHESIDF